MASQRCRKFTQKNITSTFLTAPHYKLERHEETKTNTKILMADSATPQRFYFCWQKNLNRASFQELESHNETVSSFQRVGASFVFGQVTFCRTIWALTQASCGHVPFA